MRKLLLAGLAGMLMAGPALAQDRYYDRDDRREWRDDRRDDRREWREDRRDDRRYWRNARRDYVRDFRRHDSHWAGPRYRGAYAYPRGYGYQAWGVGYRLPRAYFSSQNYILDPGYYRLPPGFSGTRWVRVGPDALLIRLADRAILRAVRGLYW